MSWGTQSWGTTQWGETAFAVVSILSATPIDYSVVRVVFRANMKRVSVSASDDATNPTNYVFVGGFRSISAKSVTIVSPTTFDVTIDEMQNNAAYLLVVAKTLTDDTGAFSVENELLSDPNADRVSFIGFGEAPSVIAVTNPSAGILHVDFSKAMNIDNRLTSPKSYDVNPIGAASPILIRGVTASSSLPTRSVIKFDGGNSPYSMTITGPIDVAGNPISVNNSILFNIVKPGIDELFTGDQVFFETDLGAIQLGFTELSQRRIEDLIILRAQSIGYEEQFKIIADALKNSGVNRDEQKLNLFKG